MWQRKPYLNGQIPARLCSNASWTIQALSILPNRARPSTSTLLVGGQVSLRQESLTFCLPCLVVAIESNQTSRISLQILIRNLRPLDCTRRILPFFVWEILQHHLCPHFHHCPWLSAALTFTNITVCLRFPRICSSFVQVSIIFALESLSRKLSGSLSLSTSNISAAVVLVYTRIRAHVTLSVATRTCHPVQQVEMCLLIVGRSRFPHLRIACATSRLAHDSLELRQSFTDWQDLRWHLLVRLSGASVNRRCRRNRARLRGTGERSEMSQQVGGRDLRVIVSVVGACTLNHAM